MNIKTLIFLSFFLGGEKEPKTVNFHHPHDIFLQMISGPTTRESQCYKSLKLCLDHPWAGLRI